VREPEWEGPHTPPRRRTRARPPHAAWWTPGHRILHPRRLALAAVAAAACLGAAVPSGPQGAVEALRKAVLDRDAAAVVGCFASQSQARHRALYRLARSGDDDALAGLAPDERALVRVLRRRAGPELRTSATLDAFLETALARGAVDAAELSRLRIGRLRGSRADGAQALVLRDGVPTGIQIGFVHERDAWRVDRVTSPLLDPLALRLASAATGLDEDAVVDELIVRITGE